MFTINIYLRFALIALSLIGGTVLAIFFGFWYAFPVLLTGLVLLVGYLLLGTVQSAAVFMQQQDFEAVEKRLNLTLTDRLLYSTNRAYYYMMKGSVAQFRQNMDEAEMWLEKASSIDVPTDNEKAMIELQLANIAASKNKMNQAKMHMRNLKGLNINDAAVKEQIKQFEKAMKQSGQAKLMGQGGAKGGQMRPGGKRRRPKMR